MTKRDYKVQLNGRIVYVSAATAAEASKMLAGENRAVHVIGVR